MTIVAASSERWRRPSMAYLFGKKKKKEEVEEEEEEGKGEETSERKYINEITLRYKVQGGSNS